MKRFTDFLTSTTDPAFAIDHDGLVFEWNRSAEEVFDRSAATVLGKPCWEVLTGGDEFGNLYCVPGCPLRTMAQRHQAVSRCRLFIDTAAKPRCEFDVTTLILPHDASDGECLVHVLSPVAQSAKASGPAANGPSPNKRRGALTVREREVLALLARGRGTVEISEFLCIGQTTTANHIQHVLHKLHVHSRLQAVVMGHRLGLI